MRTSTKLYVGAVAAIVAISPGIVLNSSGTAEFPDGSPEAAVQAYVGAVLDEDFEAADHWLTDEARKRCDETYFDSRDVQRVRIVDARVQQDAATVEIEVTYQNSGDPFASEYSSTDRFRLSGSATDWLIDEVPWVFCEGR